MMDRSEICLDSERVQRGRYCVRCSSWVADMAIHLRIYHSPQPSAPEVKENP